MIELYYSPGASSLAPHVVLEEAGADYRLVRVTREGGRVEPADFLELNPHGRIPAMRFDGLAMYESAACTMHVADLHPQAELAPALGTPERALYYRWLAHLTNTVQPAFITWFHPERTAPPGLEEATKAKAGELLAGMRDYLDADLAAAGPWVLGERYSAADAFLFMLTRWGRRLEPKWWEMPSLGGHYRRMRERPAVRRAYEQEGLEE